MVKEQVSALLKQYAAKNRVALSAYGAAFGRQVFAVREENTDLKALVSFREANSNNVPFVNRPIKHFVIKRIDIMKAELALTANDKPVIIINGGTDNEITCNIGKPEFDRKVDSNSIREAIENQKNGGNQIYFKDLDHLTAEVNRLNSDNDKDIVNLIEYLQNQHKVLQQDAIQNNADLNQYHSETDNTDSLETVVNVTVNQEEG